jgi:putative FmdB family regulatory protein
MPLYEYKCDKCGNLFEVMQKFSDEPLKTHENCGGSVHRLLSAPALQFKGSGWYITDYAKSGGGKSEAGKSDATKSNGQSKSESSSASKSDSSASTTTSASTSSSDKK